MDNVQLIKQALAAKCSSGVVRTEEESGGVHTKGTLRPQQTGSEITENKC